MKTRLSFILLMLLGLFSTIGAASAQTTPVVSVGTAKNFACNTPLATLRTLGTPSVTVGNTTIFIGYRQVSANNKNPIMVRYNGNRKVWCRANYETTGDDGTGYGILWDGGTNLYAVFSATGTQGTASRDFRRFATTGWLRSYGAGGGAKVAIIARINAADGTARRASFLTAVKSDGKTNSVQVTSLGWANSQLTVYANSWFSPRKADKSAYNCNGGSSPFNHTVVFVLNLSSVVSTSASAPCY